MTKNIIYGGWFRKQIVGEYKPAKAQKAHLQGKPYRLVIAENPENPDCFLEIGASVIHVGFIDELKRLCLMCYFSTELSGRLFLNTADYPEYEGDTDHVIKRTQFVFTAEGQFNIVTIEGKTNDFRDNITTIRRAKEPIDVSYLWADYPAFGDYDALIAIATLFPKRLQEVNFYKKYEFEEPLVWDREQSRYVPPQ